LRDEVLHVGEALDDHETVYACRERVAHAVHVVARQVYEHDMFRAVLQGTAQLLRESSICFWGFPPYYCPRDGMGDDAAKGGFDEEFGAGADKLEGGAVNVEEVGGGVYGAEVTVDVEGVESRGAGEALGRYGLDDVAIDDVGFEAGDVRLVPGAANVGGVFLVLHYWRLWREWDVWIREYVDNVLNYRATLFICGREFLQGLRDGEIRHHFDDLEEVVEANDSLEEHEQAFRNVEDIFQWTRNFRLEVADAVIANVTDCTAGKGGEV
jgi:hypothetical protein